MAVSRAQTPLCGQPWGGGGEGEARGPGQRPHGPLQELPLDPCFQNARCNTQNPKGTQLCKKKVPSLRGEGCGPVEREDRAAPAPCGNLFSGTLDPTATLAPAGGGASPCLLPTFQPQEAARPPYCSPTLHPFPLRLSRPVLPRLRPRMRTELPEAPGLPHWATSGACFCTRHYTEHLGWAECPAQP